MLAVLCVCLLVGCAPALGAVQPPTTAPTSTPDTVKTAEMATEEARQYMPEWQLALPTIPTPTAPPLTATPISTPAITGTSRILDVSAQAAALLPGEAAVLNRADAWDHYLIYATLLPDELTVLGEMQVQLRNRGSLPMDALYFRLYPNHEDFGGSLEIAEGVLVNGQPVAVNYEQDNVLLRLGLAQPLLPGEVAVAELQFSARTQRNASGSAYGAFNREAGVWSLASFYPVLARRFGNDWDRRTVSGRGDLAVTQTALYDVTIDTPPALRLASTGFRIAQQPLEHGPRRERFVSGPQRDFFLAALQGLQQASTSVGGTRIISYYQGSNPAAGQHSLDVAAQSVRIFNDWFGTYPLAELEMIQVPLTRFWGVEYPGIILIEQALYRIGGRDLDTTVAHEVAHQWWYSLVGNDVQGEPWLDEGLTSYSQVIYYEGQGNQVAAQSELQRFRDQYQQARSAGRDDAIGGSVDAYGGNYLAIVYAKAALFFHALRLHMGDEAFFQFLREYYATYRYQEASGEDMLRIAEGACRCNLQPLYNAWVNEGTSVDVP